MFSLQKQTIQKNQNLPHPFSLTLNSSSSPFNPTPVVAPNTIHQQPLAATHTSNNTCSNQRARPSFTAIALHLNPSCWIWVKQTIRQHKTKGRRKRTSCWCAAWVCVSATEMRWKVNLVTSQKQVVSLHWGGPLSWEAEKEYIIIRTTSEE